jgi:hypothetical protein
MLRLSQSIWQKTGFVQFDTSVPMYRQEESIQSHKRPAAIACGTLVCSAAEAAYLRRRVKSEGDRLFHSRGNVRHRRRGEIRRMGP